MENKYLSIKDFAAAIGVTKQAVYKQLNNKLQPYLKVVDGKKMIEKSALSLFDKKPEVNQEEQQTNNQLTEKLIAMLQKELDEKNQQIAELQKLLNQAQQLNAMDKQKILELEDKMAAEPETPKKSFWSRFKL